MRERFQNHAVPFENELSQASSGAISEADVLITAALMDRPTRQPDLAAENQALRTLSQQLMEGPQSLLRTLVQIVQDLCQADTVGVSLLETLPNGTSVFRWVAIAGALEFLEQTTTPANFSPCGTTIRRDCPQLYTHPERYFTYLHDPQFPVVEALLLPLCVNSQPLGTIWIVSHTEGRQFDREDQRLMTSLAGFTAAALQSIHLRQMTEQALRREQEIRTQQQQAETSLRQSEAFNQQILDGSDDCIKVLDLAGRLLYMNQRGQALIGIQEMALFLNAAWIEFWQNADDKQAALDALDTAKAGGVGNFQGYCPNLAGEPKWWDVKVTPIWGAAGQVERLLCISRDITERRRIEEERHQDQESLRQSEERLAAIFSHAAVGLSEISLEGRFQRVNDELCQMLRRSRQDLLTAGVPDITHPNDVSRSLEAFGQLVETGQPVSFDKRYLRSDGTIVWANSSLTRLDDEQGRPRSVLAVTVDLSDRKQAEEALRKSEAEFRLFTAASSDTVYKMSADWREMRLLEGKNFLASTQHLNQTWLEQYIPLEEQTRVKAAIEHAIRTKSTFELEHRVIQLDGTIGWAFSRAIPLLNNQNEIVEWLGAASDVTVRKRAELSAEFLAIVTQNLAEATCVEDIIQTVGEQLNRYLHIANCAFVEINESAEIATIAHSWHQADMPSLVGSYPLSEFVTGEFFQTAKLGQTIIVRDTTTDPRIADSQRFAALNIGSFINVPLIRNDEWKFTLGIYHRTPYNWRSDEINLMRELANRIWTKLERTRIEIALRQNQEMFSALVADAPFGIYMIDADFRFQQANQIAVAAFNIGSLIGQDLAEALRIIWQEPFATEAIHRFRHTLTTGESFYSPPIVEPRADIAEIQSYDWQIHRITLSDGRYGVVCYFYDLSEIKRAEEIIRRNANRDAFLVTLNDALRPLTDAIAIQATANHVLGEYLGATRVTYFEVRGADYVVEHDYVNGVESLQGGYPIESFGAELLATYRSGQTATSTNVATDPHLSPAQRSAYNGIQIAAYIGVPLVKQGEFVAGLAVHSSTPRRWTSDEIALAEEVAERTWAAVERARAEVALRESEEKYRGLFESLDEGYFLADVIFDENDQPIDILYLEANPAATRMVGQDFTGRRLREIDPSYEAYWYEIFGRVARTGMGERLEQYAEPDQRWYDFYVFKVGGENSRCVSVVFKDITAAKHLEESRKRREANLAFLADITEDFSRLSTADEIMQAVGAKIGAYLQVTTCNFTDVDEAHDQVTVHHGWSSPTVPSTVGTFRTSQYLSKEFERASRAGETVVVCNTQTDSRTDAAGYAALNMHSFVTVPFHRNGRWTHYIAICDSRSRDWHKDEIQLIEEISNRIFPRLERARAEAALRVSEEKYRSLFESIDQGFCLFELLFDASGKPIDYRFVNVNQAFEQQCGLADAVGKTILELAPNFEPQWIELYAQVAKSGEAIRFEADVPSLNGIFDIYAFPSGAPGQNLVAALFANITERKQAEAAIVADLRDTQLLRELSAQLATEENIQALYQEITATAIALTHADAGTVQILDEPTQELVLLATQGFDRTMVEHFHRVNASSNTPCGIALRGSIRSFVDFDVPASEDPDGSMRLHVEAGLLSAQSTPLISRSGKPIGMVSTHWRTHHRPSDRELRFLDLLARQAADLIEQRQAEAQRKQLLEREQAAREEAERANRIKDEFLAVLSHELRSPLNPILGWTRLLQNGKLDAVRQREALATIERNAKLQTQLIEDLLDISRIMRGKLSLTVAPVSLTYVISAAMETVRLAAEAKNIQIILDLAPDVALISGDAARLQQVVWNLLTNAVKFTPDGGQVIVELRQLDAAGSLLRSRLAQIRVIDTGKGISPQFLPHAFEYFLQEDGSTTRKFGGLGLGLAIVRQIVQMHGGSVWVESQGEGKGSTFIVQLPAMQQRAVVSKPNRPQSKAGLPLAGVQVLLVDDEPDTLEFQTFLLEQSGAKVTAVASGLEALQTLEQSIPDVVVSDIGMPKMDGYMLLQQIRSHPSQQGGRIPALALTAYATEIDQQRAIQVGFQSHITKPVEPEVLVRAIVTLLKRT